MKWKSKDNTRWLDLNAICYWDYAKPTEMTGTALYVIVGGVEIKFFNEEADEIYNMLINRKELL